MKIPFKHISWLLCGIFAISGISYSNVENVNSIDIPSMEPMVLNQAISEERTGNANYPKSLASYEDFKTLVTKVDSVRKNNLIDAATFAKMAKEPNTIILDTRSTDFFASAHIKGAVNLPFTEFTQARLAEIIPNTNTRILIYCNNNFSDDPLNFPSKFYMPPNPKTIKIMAGKKPIMLALNIPTYINLYGYGYQNIYELDELIRISSKVIEVESH